MTCPNCGYCPHCGRGAQPAVPHITGPFWQVPNTVPVTPTYPTYAPFPTYIVTTSDKLTLT